MNERRGVAVVLARLLRATPPPDRTGEGSFRTDIQGLRAVAVGAVLLWHAGFSWIPGGFVGVDVFFVISGFLITRLLIRERRRRGTIILSRFYARRAKRLLPASGVVIIATVAMTALFIPRIRWESIASDAIASSFYFLNWRLAGQSVDYLAQGAAPSPLQHYWSLAVEEQFYLVWPLLILLVTPKGTVRKARLIRRLAFGIALVAVPSLVWSVLYSASDPGPAFFATTTRAWEFGLGAAVAIASPTIVRLPGSIAVVLGWCGLAVLVASTTVLPRTYPFPGAAALAPTLATAAVIAAGSSAGRFGPMAVLGIRPLVFVGTISYSLYLWHWPLLIVFEAESGPLSLPQSTAVVVASILPAYLTYRFVEDPARHWHVVSSPKVGLAFGAACTVVAASIGFALGVKPPQTDAAPANLEAELERIESLSDAEPSTSTLAPTASALPTSTAIAAPPAPVDAVPTSVAGVADTSLDLGAAALGPVPFGSAAGIQAAEVETVIPDPFVAGADFGQYIRCITEFSGTEPVECTAGDVDSPVRVVLLGDSTALQWATAINTIALERGWSLQILTKAICGYKLVTTVHQGLPYDDCVGWTENVRRILLDERPALVIVASVDGTVIAGGEVLGREESTRRQAESHVTLWSELLANGTQVVALEVNPAPGFPVPECVSENRGDLRNCTFPRAATSDILLSLEMAADQLPAVGYIDLTDAICPSAECPVVIGGVLVYRDFGHLSDTYVRTLTPRLAAELERLAPDVGG